MTPAELIRDMDARNSAIRRYARAHDRFAELEQANAAVDPVEAEGAHVYALICLRAVRAELDDPRPKEPPHA